MVVVVVGHSDGSQEQSVHSGNVVVVGHSDGSHEQSSHSGGSRGGSQVGHGSCAKTVEENSAIYVRVNKRTAIA